MSRAWTAILAAGLMTLAAGAQQADNAQTVSGFRVPEYDDENNLKSELFGEFARVLPDGVIEISQLKIDVYNKKGKVDMTVTAPKCAYNQKEGLAKSDTDVRIARENMVVTGVGFSWNGQNERFEILNKAKVVLKEAQKQVDTGVKE
jgi:hypothetical protein